jgi:hypothetical protein
MTAGNDNNEFFRVITFITMTMMISTAVIWVAILIFAGII